MSLAGVGGRTVAPARHAYVLASSAETAEGGVVRHALHPGQTRGATLCGIDEPSGRWQLHGFARDGNQRIQCERCRVVAVRAASGGGRAGPRATRGEVVGERR
jgi:hypothetical protein